MHSRFQILLRGYLGVWNNLGVSIFEFYSFTAFLWPSLWKYFEGLHLSLYPLCIYVQSKHFTHFNNPKGPSSSAKWHATKTKSSSWPVVRRGSGKAAFESSFTTVPRSSYVRAEKRTDSNSSKNSTQKVKEMLGLLINADNIIFLSK